MSVEKVSTVRAGSSSLRGRGRSLGNTEGVITPFAGIFKLASRVEFTRRDLVRVAIQEVANSGALPIRGQKISSSL